MRLIVNIAVDFILDRSYETLNFQKTFRNGRSFSMVSAIMTAVSNCWRNIKNTARYLYFEAENWKASISEM